MKQDKRKWCWSFKNGEEVYGPFNSRDEAIADAQTEIAGPVLIGRCCYPNPAEILVSLVDSYDLDIHHIFEIMDERAVDNAEGNSNDATFGLLTSYSVAKKDLKNLLSRWAKKHIRTLWFHPEDEEEVEV